MYTNKNVSFKTLLLINALLNLNKKQGSVMAFFNSI